MSKPSRSPKYGDEVFVPSEHPDGHWTNGIVNSGFRGMPHPGGRLLIAAPGHAKSNMISVPIDGYGRWWRYPQDVGEKPVGAKPTSLDDLQG